MAFFMGLVTYLVLPTPLTTLEPLWDVGVEALPEGLWAEELPFLGWSGGMKNGT
jgi:hypothetical protein